MKCGRQDTQHDCETSCACNLAIVRGDVYPAEMECRFDTECTEEGVYETCEAQALDGIDPSDVADTFLSACEARVTDCPDLVCDSTWIQFADTIIEDLTACLQDSNCDGLGTCFLAVFDQAC